MNQVIGGYTLRRLLGSGGMGEVHLATTPTGGLAAVKVIHPALARDPAFRRRFEREVAAARRVARFCTAPVLDAGIDGNIAYLVTEYVKGPDLARAVHDQGPFSGSNLDALAVGIATALSAIHGAGVIHRDLKPSNVLLSPLGPRVIDFGIAQLVEHDGLTSQAILGTPAFMAPEQVRGEPLTPAADVFAWGGVIAYAGTGRPPFGSGAAGEVLYRVVREDPPLDGLDEGIRGVVERALAKDPRRRPTAQGLLGELVGGTRLTTATEVVERTWTTLTTPPGTVPPSAAPAGVLPLGAAQPGAGRSDAARPGDIAPGAAARGAAPAGAAPAGAAQHGNAPSNAAQPGTAPPHAAQPGAVAPGAVPPSAVPGGQGAGGGSAVRGHGEPPAGVRRRRWPWIAGIAAVVLAAAVAVPVLSRESWPYEAGFGDSWEVGASQGGSAKRSGSGYELSVKPGWRLWKSAPRREPAGGVVVSARATLEDGSGQYGVWCHGSAGSGDRYEFGVSGSGEVTIVKRRTGTEGTILYGPAGVGSAAANRIVAECGNGGDSGNEDGGSGGKVTLRMWLNDRLVAEASDTEAPYGPGEAGVHAASGASGSLRVRFDSFALGPAGQ
ncbi:protein kinase [Nonomuraea phyllanthi]|uniref:Protein kinase n=1 Tax=Nonomuraea phyllanthi TaxID=2219224 RepID=A0A5C4WVB6_9ACTN|nr:serine/threonine-protein kinase [Nonomuraea phyllanthi]KAB8197540.1 protein kinase [Nonomuraea phyllanthi]